MFFDAFCKLIPKKGPLIPKVIPKYSYNEDSDPCNRLVIVNRRGRFLSSVKELWK